MSTWLYLLCGLIAVLGRILGQALGARKDLANRSRQYRLERLVDAWRSIELAARGPRQECLEGALRDIQLFGAPAHVESAARVVRALEDGSDPAPQLVGLLEALRGELRLEMRLSRQVIPLAVTHGGSPATAARGHRARISLVRGRHRGGAPQPARLSASRSSPCNGTRAASKALPASANAAVRLATKTDGTGGRTSQ